MEDILGSENTVPSTPSAVVFSDEAQHTSSPPSSPPGFPWEQAKPTESVQNPIHSETRNAFSVLGKRKALDATSENVRPTKRAAVQQTKQPAKPLSQMQISLGQEISKKCKTCGMEYIQSSTEDRKLHDKYHKQNTEGYDVGKDFVLKARPYSTFKVARSEDVICALDCFDKPARKKRGRAALEVVQRELGAVEIPEKAIWGFSGHIVVTDGDYTAYLYIRGTKCIGVLLVQKIEKAYLVVEPPMSEQQLQMQRLFEMNVQASAKKKAKDTLLARRENEEKRLQEQAQKPLQLSKDTTTATLGISRIWTSSTHRYQGIAMSLLNTAFKAHNENADRSNSALDKAREHPSLQGRDMSHIDALTPRERKLESKDDIAFSQPTEAGTKLARNWFGKIFGWKVYVD